MILLACVLTILDSLPSSPSHTSCQYFFDNNQVGISLFSLQ